MTETVRDKLREMRSEFEVARASIENDDDSGAQLMVRLQIALLDILDREILQAADKGMAESAAAGWLSLVSAQTVGRMLRTVLESGSFGASLVAQHVATRFHEHLAETLRVPLFPCSEMSSDGPEPGDTRH